MFLLYLNLSQMLIVLIVFFTAYYVNCFLIGSITLYLIFFDKIFVTLYLMFYSVLVLLCAHLVWPCLNVV